MQLKNRRRGL